MYKDAVLFFVFRSARNSNATRARSCECVSLKEDRSCFISSTETEREREYVRRDTHKMLCEKSFGDCCCVSCAGGRCCCCTLCFWFTHFFHSSCSYKSFLCVAILFIVHSKILLHFLYFIALKPMRWWLTRSLHTHTPCLCIFQRNRERECVILYRGDWLSCVYLFCIKQQCTCGVRPRISPSIFSVWFFLLLLLSAFSWILFFYLTIRLFSLSISVSLLRLSSALQQFYFHLSNATLYVHRFVVSIIFTSFFLLKREMCVCERSLVHQVKRHVVQL